MFYGVPGGLSGSQWGTQDANGVWSGWANGGQPAQAAYDPGTGAAFGGAADAYSSGGANAYMAGLPSGGDAPSQYSQPSYNPSPFAPQAPQPSAASFGGGTGPAYSAPASTASFGGSPASFGGSPATMGAPDTFAGGSAGVNPMTGTSAPSGMDMGAFLRGLDWSPQNAQNATRQMTQAMAQNGWTSDQVGANLGFTGAQMDAHIAKYGAPATGAQASGAGGPGMSGYGSMPQNPYLPGIAGDITRRTTDMMNAGIRNARGGAIMAGGFGGSAQGIMEGKAISGASDNLAGQLAGLYGGAWNQDQSRDLQRYGMDQGFYTSQRGQDLQQAGIGASLMQNGMNMDWLPVQNASGLYSGYTGLGSVTTPGSGGGWQGALGGALGAGQFAQNMGWWK